MSILLCVFLVCLTASFLLWFDSVAVRYVTVFVFVCVFVLHAFADINSLEDLSYYSLGFDEIKKMSFLSCLTTDVEVCKMERGFACILKLFSLIGLDFRCFLIVNSAVFSLLFYKSIVAYSPSRLLSALLFLLTINSQSIYVLRQYIVVAFFFYSIDWIIRREMLKYLGTCFLCFFIHQSSIVLIPLYFLYNIDAKRLINILLTSALVLKIFIQIVVSYFGSSLVGYAQYALYDEVDGQNSTGFIISAFYLFIYVWFLKYRFYDIGLNRLVFICALLNCLLLFLGLGFGFTGRLSIYFGALNILLVPIVLEYISSMSLKIALIVGCLAFNALFAFFGSLSIEASNLKLVSFM